MLNASAFDADMAFLAMRGGFRVKFITLDGVIVLDYIISISRESGTDSVCYMYNVRFSSGLEYFCKSP